jgi:PPOX class probable F420-dependent enzyme
VDRAEAERRAAGARVARLGTIGPGGRVDLVPCTFALDGDRFVTAVDHKPKATVRLQRLANIEADPRVTVLIDEYDDEWRDLWWVRLRGRARVLDDEGTRAAAVGLLVAKYSAYGDRPPAGPVLEATIDDWRWWAWER